VDARRVEFTPPETTTLCITTPVKLSLQQLGNLTQLEYATLGGMWTAAAIALLMSPFLAAAAASNNVTPFTSELVHASETLMVGSMAVAAVITEKIAHGVGRRSATLSAATLLTCGILATALAQTQSWFVVGRCLVGAGAGAIFLASNLLAAEMVRDDNQVSVPVVLNASWGLGALSTAGLAALFGIEQWRYLAGAALPLALLVTALATRMQESPLWLITEERGAAKARVALRKIAIQRNLPRPDMLSEITHNVAHEARREASIDEDDDDDEQSRLGGDADPQYASFNDLITPLMLVSAAVAFFYFGLTLGLNNLSGSLYFNSAFGAAAEFPAYAAVPIIARLLGLRTAIAVALMLGSVALGFCGCADPALVYFANFCGKFAVCVVYSSLYTFAAEATAPHSRGVTFGLMRVADGVGSIAATLVAKLPNPFTVFAVIIFAAAFVSNSLP